MKLLYHIYVHYFSLYNNSKCEGGGWHARPMFHHTLARKLDKMALGESLE